MILGTIATITAMSAGYVTILKMCGGDYEVSREENQRRYEHSEYEDGEKYIKKCYNTGHRNRKPNKKHNTRNWMTKKKSGNIIDNHVFDE
jgi:hypothetical protein